MTAFVKSLFGVWIFRLTFSGLFANDMTVRKRIVFPGSIVKGGDSPPTMLDLLVTMLVVGSGSIVALMMRA